VRPGAAAGAAPAARAGFQTRRHENERRVGARLQRARRALTVTRVIRRTGIRRVLGEIGVVGDRTATREGARAFREALEELGTTFIKLGQLLSSRPDLLPDVYIDELRRLVDQVPPVPFGEIEKVIAEDVGLNVFARLDPEPLATASIAQTHLGLLESGRKVVVKVRRPGVPEQVDLDLALLRSTAKLLHGHSSAAQLLQVEALADELEVHLLEELDFREEAHNAELIRGLVADFDDIVVPQVVRPHVTERVLVLEHVAGRKVAADHGLAPQVAEALARQFFRAYVRQVTVEGVYHADPHTGNVLITDDGRLALLDFGLLGRLDDDTRRGLGLLLLAIAQNRADDVADLILSLSLTGMDSQQPEFLHDVRRKLPRFQWRPLAGIAAGEALADLQRIALRYRIALPPSFALVGKTLAQADEIARTLYPQLDPIELLEEDALGVMLQETERRLEPNRLFAQLYTQLDPVTRLPRRINHLVTELERGALKVGVVPTGLGELEHNLRSIANRIGAALIVAALLVASALMARVHDLRWVALAGFSLAFALGVYMVWKIIRTPGEL
jgi:ubiquinone biosynthesis protein